MTVWIGTPPKVCDHCLGNIVDEFVDGRVPQGGQWGNFHSSCAIVLGVTLGTGRGQKYEKRDDKFVKTAG